MADAWCWMAAVGGRHPDDGVEGMIQKYYSGIIEQEFRRLGKHENNILLVKYNNEYSLQDFKFPAQIKSQKEVFLDIHEFNYQELLGPYEPFLDLICNMFRRYGTGDFEAFLDENGVYDLHQGIFMSYYKAGMCRRKERLILPEVSYEKQRMSEEMIRLLAAVSRLRPFMLILNRMQIAPLSTVMMISSLLKAETDGDFSIILSMNDASPIPQYLNSDWEEMMELLEDRNRIIHIGRAGQHPGDTENVLAFKKLTRQDVTVRITNLISMMDFEQALYYLKQLDRRIKFENIRIDEDFRFEIYYFFAQTCLATRDLAKTLELCQEFKDLVSSAGTARVHYVYHYLLSAANMYQGRLPDALAHARRCQEIAEEDGEGDMDFQARLLEIQIKMSGWSNIFFCAQNIEIDEKFLERIRENGYLNHLAYIYVYAYDNDAELLKQDVEDPGTNLKYFNQGIELAKKIDNYHLLYCAYQKNIMLASTNGLNETALYYSIRTYETLQNKETQECGRMYCSIGYNLSAMGRYREAEEFYRRAIALFYRLRLPEDIVEVFYNYSLNCIAKGDYKEAESYLMQCMKAIRNLKLNSLRVCNISKLYGILALTNALQGNHFNCERHLHSCKQFLNYIFEKEHADNQIGIRHDYASCDDDMFLYYFAKALLAEMQQDASEAYECYMTAEKHLAAAEGNSFYCSRLFRKARISFFEKTGRREQMEQERQSLDILEERQHEHEKNGEYCELPAMEEAEKLQVHLDGIATEQIDALIKQEGVNRSHQATRRQLEFLSVWQKMINDPDFTPKQLLEMVMRSFKSHFSVDRAFYVRFRTRKAEVLYNDTECEITDEMLKYIAGIFEKDQHGFAVSKISSDYSEHLNLISIFGEDDVCSMVAVPFFNNGKVESILITYILMKENWHSSVNRYMLDDDDLIIYELLFREVSYALKRIDNSRQIVEMNRKLYQAAVTDQLTGVYNRKGLYQRIEKMVESIGQGKMQAKVSVMFVDLDNFKNYNDYYGHNVGDLILRGMAAIFKKIVEGKGYVFRYGGDEFILLVKSDDRLLLENMAKRVYEEIAAVHGFRGQIEKEITLSNGEQEPAEISCSIGIATGTGTRKQEDILEMMKQADKLLYEIKHETKGTYKFI